MLYRVEFEPAELRGSVGQPLPVKIRVRYEDSGEAVKGLTVRFSQHQTTAYGGDIRAPDRIPILFWGGFTLIDIETDVNGCASAVFVPFESGHLRIICLVAGQIAPQAASCLADIKPAEPKIDEQEQRRGLKRIMIAGLVLALFLAAAAVIALFAPMPEARHHGQSQPPASTKPCTASFCPMRHR